MSQRRVLITGASGFVGQHCLAPLRERGYEIVAVHQRPTPPEAARRVEGVRWIQADLLTPGCVPRLLAEASATHLLHLAWTVEPGKMISDPANLEWLRASLELLQRFHEGGGQRIVVGGSCYEYDWRYGFCNEALTPRLPNTLYGAAKNGLYEAMMGYATSVGLSAAWGRMFFLYGPGENPRRLVPSVVLSLLKGEPAMTSHGLQIRDYMHVQDVAGGMVALLDSSATGSYNIASGKATAISSIVRMLGDLCGRADLLRIGAIPARANDAPLVIGDVGTAKRDFGWESSIPLEEGLKSTVQWWLAERARQSQGAT